jgi:DHA1 family tetracycline resistance protein-like MFS transporter
VISFGVVIPIVPLLFTEPSSKFFILEGLSRQMGYIILGLTIGLYPLGQFISTPLLGELSDVYGRRRIIQLSILGTVISSAVFAIGVMKGSFIVLFVSRFFNGLTGGLISVAQATIADVTDKADKSKNFGILGVAFGVGFMMGPFLGGVLSTDMFALLGITTPFWFAAAVSGLSGLFVTFTLQETSPMKKESINWRKPFSQLKKGLQIPGIRDLLAANFFYFSGFAFFTTFIPVFLVERFGFSQLSTGNFFFYIGVLAIIGQGILVPKVFSRFDEGKVMPVTFFLTGVFILLQPFSPSLTVFLVLVTLFSLNNSLTNVSLNSLVSNASPEEDQGLALGTNQSLRALGNAFPSILSGVAAAAFMSSAPLMISGIILITAALVYAAAERISE